MIIRQHILLRRPDVVVTPHMAFYSREAEERILETTVENIRAFFSGKPIAVSVPFRRANNGMSWKYDRV